MDNMRIMFEQKAGITATIQVVNYCDVHPFSNCVDNYDIGKTTAQIPWRYVYTCIQGDTVLPIETTKKMKHNVKDKKRKQDCVEYTEQFPQEATDWLGYGATIKVKWGAKWLKGVVIGREPEGIMVKYGGGIGVHADLHTRGCRIKVFKRRIDLDERYKQDPFLKCPFGQKDDECVCYRCREEKWPGLYGLWELTDSQIEEIESISPSQRREWAENHVIGEHLFANSENVENDGRSDESGRGIVAQSDEDEEGQDYG